MIFFLLTDMYATKYEKGQVGTETSVHFEKKIQNGFADMNFKRSG